MENIVRIVIPMSEGEPGNDAGIRPGIGVAYVEVTLTVAADEEGTALAGLRRPEAETVMVVRALRESRCSRCHADQSGLDATGVPQIELSGTEMLVLKHIVDGMTNHDIRTRMTISPKTLETHITHIYSSLRSVGILPPEPSAENRGMVIRASRDNRFRIVPRLPRRRYR